jgi:hypothetical protein
MHLKEVIPVKNMLINLGLIHSKRPNLSRFFRNNFFGCILSLRQVYGFEIYVQFFEIHIVEIVKKNCSPLYSVLCTVCSVTQTNDEAVTLPNKFLCHVLFSLLF